MRASTRAPAGTNYPQRDESGNLLVTEFGRSKYRDNQMVTIQELPETAPPGQLPHSSEPLPCLNAGPYSLARPCAARRRRQPHACVSMSPPPLASCMPPRGVPPPRLGTHTLPPPPAAVEVLLEDDLVDSVKPGDRVAIVGIFRPLAGAVQGMTTGMFR